MGEVDCVGLMPVQNGWFREGGIAWHLGYSPLLPHGHLSMPQFVGSRYDQLTGHRQSHCRLMPASL